MGLGSNWDEVLDVLEKIIPVYDKVNSSISLGRDSEFRQRGIQTRVKRGDKILDAGSGFGNMSKTALQICDAELKITLYDPLRSMLKNTCRLFTKSPALACGVFEHVPFRDETFETFRHFYFLQA